MNEYTRQCGRKPPFDVMVIAWQDGRTVFVLGEAVLEGYFELGDTQSTPEQSLDKPPVFSNPHTDVTADVSGKLILPVSPRIRFASGEVLWGCECYWSPLAFWNDSGRSQLIDKGLELADISLADFRAQRAANGVQSVDEMVASIRASTDDGCNM